MKRRSTAPGGAATRFGGRGLARDVLAAVVGDPRRPPLLAEEDRRAARCRPGDRLAFVEGHLPAGRQVVDGQGGAIEVGDLLHGFTQDQRVAPVMRGDRRLGQQDPFVRVRWAVDAGPFEEADAADAEDVGDEAEAGAVEGEQDRATGELALRLLDAVQPSARQIDLGLQDAVGPDQ